MFIERDRRFDGLGIAQEPDHEMMICYAWELPITFCFHHRQKQEFNPREVISAIINGTNELVEELAKMGVNVYPTGGETADVGDWCVLLLTAPSLVA